MNAFIVDFCETVSAFRQINEQFKWNKDTQISCSICRVDNALC